MDTYNSDPSVFGNQPVMPLPNATPVLILGILSIPFCCAYGIIGLVMGVIALVLAKKDERLYHLNPAAYTVNSYKNLRSGRVCAIIGIVMGSLYTIMIIILIAIFGIALITHPAELQQSLQNMR